MATLTIRNLPDEVRDRLRVRAAERGRSMEAEAREVLTAAVAGVNPPDQVRRRQDWAKRVKRIQKAMEPYRSKDKSVVDEFLAERREEAWREDEKWRRLEREAEEARRRASADKRETQAEKLERARAILRRRVPEGTSLVDEFLAERRAMWGEE